MIVRRSLLTAACAGLLGMTCTRAAENVSQFGLRDCPHESFSMPDRRGDGSYSVVRVPSKSNRDLTEPGSEVYRLYHDDLVLAYYRVRLVQGRSCRLAVEYSLLDKASRSDSALTQERQRAGVVARLVLQGTSNTPQFPALWVERREPGNPPDMSWNQ